MRVYRRSFGGFVAAAVMLSSMVSAARTPQSTNLPEISIENFGRINENYYRGARPEKDQFAQLAALGIKTVINLERKGMPEEQEIVESLGMTFHRIGLSTKSRPKKEEVNQFLAIVSDPAKQPVYVHCAGGRHRTGVMTAVYRFVHDAWNADQAYEEMKKYDFEDGLFVNTTLRGFVYDEYEAMERAGVIANQQRRRTTVSPSGQP